MQLNARHRLADRIWQWRKITYAISTVVVAVAIVAVFLSISSPSTLVRVSTEPTFFEASRAFRSAQMFAATFPDRTAGFDGDAASAAWLSARLKELKIPSSTQTFTAQLGDRMATLHNVVVVLPGESKEAIMLSAQRDPTLARTNVLTPPTLTLGDAAGTAILLDLIQVFASRPHEKTLIFLSSDGGGYGGLGVDRFLRAGGGADVRAVMSIYGLGREDRHTLQAGIEGPDGTSPGWLFQLATATMADAGFALDHPGLATQVAEHALRLADGEESAGLAQGVPSIGITDAGPGRVTAASLATQGAAVERLLLSLDGGTEIPPDPGTAVVLGSGRYLTNGALDFLATLMLLPGTLMALTWLAVTRIRPDAWARYLRNLASFVLPLLAVLGLVWLASRVGLLPHYDLPAPPDDPPARIPDYLVSAAVAAAGLLLFLLSRHFLGYLRPRESLVMAETVKLSIGLIVLVVGLGLLASHSAFSILTAVTAAWAWPLVTCFAEPSRTDGGQWYRARTNRLLLFSGLVAPAALYVYLTVATSLSWRQGWWWLMTQTASGAYGVRGPVASVLITAGFLVLLGVKRLRLIPVETLESDDLAMVLPSPRVRKVKRREQPSDSPKIVG